ncbi:ankyrin repeat and MYND domain-containing protein 2-like [Littorina saxatilis]|uniref:MYND-type domain-containing protein n=1 Tax=Littorina saxatilis TaxID=31220 RepID=A0AAN9ATV0_9CAEN
MAPVVKGELSDAEQKMLDAILKGSTAEIAALLKEPGVRVDCLDKTGMTPLQHAAFKGRADVCRLLLDNGADVNSNYHENDYSTLHFAALSGKVDVTNLVLEAGANVDHTNSVNRTASQMAAFVGQHDCVRAINNFFPKFELEKFTVPTGFEKEPKLPPVLLNPLYLLINSTNLNPVKVALFLKEHRDLVLESYKVCKVLDLVVECAMKSRSTNDVQAIKCHYFASIIRHANKSLKNSEDNLDAFVKSLAKGRDSDGFQEMQDRLVRQSLKEFPYPESQLLQTLVRQIAPMKIGDGSALSVLISGMYGPSFEDDTACTTCGETKAEKKCSACKCVNYCNQTCQKLHWPTHKKFCKILAVEQEKREAKQKEEEKRQKQKQAEMEAEMKAAKLTEATSSEETQTKGDNSAAAGGDNSQAGGSESKTEESDINGKESGEEKTTDNKTGEAVEGSAETS